MTVLVANDAGVFLIDPEGEVTHLVEGSVAYAVDDTRGGLLFQVERGRSPAWWGEDSRVRDTRVWWVPGGSSEARELLVPTPRKPLDLSLHDSFEDTDGHHNVVYVLHDSTRSPVGRQFVWSDSLKTYTVDDGSVNELVSSPGWEAGLGQASGWRDGVAVTEYDQVGSACTFLSTPDGAPLSIPGSPEPDPSCEVDCPHSCVMSEDGERLAYVTDRVVTLGVDNPHDRETFEFDDPMGTLDVTSGHLLVNHRSDRSGPNGPATLIDLATGVMTKLPIDGVARFVTAPIEFAEAVVAPEPVPALHGGFWTVIVESIDSAAHDREYALERVDTIEAATGIRLQVQASEVFVTPGSGYWVLYDGFFETRIEAAARARVLEDAIGFLYGGDWRGNHGYVQWVATPQGAPPAGSDTGARLGEIERISLEPGGGEFLGAVGVTNQYSAPSASCVVFATSVQSGAGDPSAVPGLYMRDRRADSTIEVTILPDGSRAVSRLEGVANAQTPRLVGVSADCGRVVFAIEDDSGWHLYLRDLVAGASRPLTPDVPLSKNDPLPASPEPAYAWGVGPWDYSFGSDRTLETIEVRRESIAQAAVMGVRPIKAYGEVYRFDTTTGRQTLAEVYQWERDNRTGPEDPWHDGDPYHGVLSRSGRWSVFRSDVAESDDDTRPGPDLFLHDFGTDRTLVLPLQVGERQVTGAAVVGDLGNVVLTLADGGHALWRSGGVSDLNLPTGATVTSADPALRMLGVVVDGLAYVFEVSTGDLLLASQSGSGVLPDIRNSTIGFSDDGSTAIIGSSATNLVTGDTNNATGPRPYSVEAGFDLFAVPIESSTQ